jgi:putative transcriptional regulator
MYTTDNLRIIRIKNNLSIYDMAKYLNITPAYYSLIENKKRNLYYDLAIKIASIFNMKPDNIFIQKNQIN